MNYKSLLALIFFLGVAFGQSSASIRLNGQDAVGYCASGPARISSNTTWEAWVRFDVAGVNNGYAPILWQFGLWAYGAPMVDVNAGNVATSSGYASQGCSIQVSRRAWHHIACVFGPEASPSNALYVDGQFACYNPGGPNVPAPTPRMALALGAVDCCYYNFPSFSGFFNGDIDEARLSSVQRYSGAFTPQLRLLADSATIGLWHFDEGSGPFAYDSSGNGFHFALSGGYAWGSGADAASIQTLGTGCAGSLGVPVLSGVNASVPRLGQAVSLRVDHVPSARGAALMANLTGVSMGVALPVDLASYGLPGCQLYAFGLSGPFTAEVGNVVNWSMSIPNVAALSGFAFDVQALIFDVASSQAGLALSNGLRLTLGS
jgi:hypothetical protein